MSDTFPPLSFLDGQGRLQGLVRDRWRLWEQRTGIAVKLMPMDWLEAQRAVQTGRADVIASLARTSQREARYLFVNRFMEVEVSLYFDRDLSGIVDVESSRSFPVGVRGGDVCIEKLLSLGNSNLKIYSNYEALIAALVAREIRVVCMNRLPADYLLAQRGLSNRFLHSPPIYASSLYDAVRRDNGALAETVRQGFAMIRPEEEQALQRKWRGIEPDPLRQRLAREAGKLLVALLTAATLMLLWNASLRRTVKRRTSDLERARDILSHTIEAIPDPLIELSKQGVIQAVHSSRRDLLTRPVEQQIGHHVRDVLSPSAAGTVMAALACADREGFCSGQEIEVALPGGMHSFELSVSKRSIADHQGQEGFLMLCRDISQRTQLERSRQADQRRLQRMNRLYATLSECNQMILQAGSEEALFQEVCRIAVRSGEFKMAWVGRLEPGSGKLTPVAWAGEGTGYLKNIEISLDPSTASGRGPMGTALRRDEPIWCQDFLADPTLAPWHERALHYGWGSVGVLPLHREGAVYGGLGIYTNETNSFDDQSQALLIDLTRDIDLALDHFRTTALRRVLEEEVKASEAKYRNLTESIHDVVWSLDPEGMRYLYVSPSVTRMRGFTPEEVMSQPFAASFVGEEGQRISEQIAAELVEFHSGLRSSELVSVDEVEQPCKDGGTIWTEIITNFVLNPATGKVEVHGVARDITERRFAYEQIQRLAYFDQLTGLANRTLLRDRFRNALNLSKKNGLPLAVLYLDLDHFRNINDTLGHAVGDKLLVEVAKRLKAELRPGDTLSHYGGDEFTVLLPDSDADATLEMIQCLMRTMAPPFRIGEEELFVTLSMGIAMFPGDGTSMETLLRNADTAMNQVKKERRNGFQFFTPAEQERSSRHLRLSNALYRALEHQELALHYQPQVRIDSQTTIGAEALIRWHHPELGMISPAEFIPIAEASGLIVPIGEWVLRQAVTDARQWIGTGEHDFTISVNISAIQFRNSDLHLKVLRILNEEDFPPNRLELELTESVTLENPKIALQLMTNLHTHGIQLAIDDFGTGYSSLSYLSRIRAQRLKIDRSFITNMACNHENRAIVQAIINLAKTMGMRTIAEGVETLEQLSLLRSDGCDEIQGYVFSQPLPAHEFTQLLNQKDRIL